MQLIFPAARSELLANFRDEKNDHVPVVKLFTPWAGATWLLTEMVEHDQNIMFGLCDVGQGYPELGYVALSEIEAVRGPGGLRIERDIHFEPLASVGVYAAAARQADRIVENRDALEKAFLGMAAKASESGKPCRGFVLFSIEGAG